MRLNTGAGAEMMLSFAQPAPHDKNWADGSVEFEKLLASQRESAPGPDGVPYSVHHYWSQILFFAAHHAILQGTDLPEGFGASRTFFFSPKSSEVNAQGLRTRSPESLRPLASSNFDCKMPTAATCSGLRRYPIECVHPSHRCVT